MAVASEDVVFQYERMRTVHDRAEDLLHLAEVFDPLDHPPSALVRLPMGQEALSMGGDQEELLRKVGPHQSQSVHRAGVSHLTIRPQIVLEARPHVLTDAVGADADAGAQIAYEFKMSTRSRVERDAAVGRHVSIRLEVSRQPAEQVRQR